MAKANKRNVRFVIGVVALAVMTLSAASFLAAQDAKAPKFQGRLPAYYGDIVTETQKLQIYAVQERYAKQIDALKAQLELTELKRDKEIEDVLRPEQKEKLKKAQQAAAERRKKSAAVKKAIEEAAVANAAATRVEKKGK